MLDRGDKLLDARRDDVDARRRGRKLRISLVGDSANRPVSAIRKFAPEMPISAERNFWRNSRRALATKSATSPLAGACLCLALKSRATSSRVLCMAGHTMCDGVSPASCTICSARSVSTRSSPAASSACGRPISSPSMDFERVTRFAPAVLQIPVTIRQASPEVWAQCTLASDCNPVFSILKVMAEMGNHVVLDRSPSLSCGFEFGEAADSRGSVFLGRACGALDGCLKRRVRQRCFGLVFECQRDGSHSANPLRRWLDRPCRPTPRQHA